MPSPCSCGPFVGYFKDVHRSPENSDEEEEADNDEDCMPKDYGRIHRAEKDSLFRRLRNARRAVLKKGADDPVLNARGWNPYRTVVSIEKRNSGDVTLLELPAVKVENKIIAKSMMNKLTTISKCHTIEIINCHLKDIPMDLSKEIDNMHVLRVSYNDIARIRRGSFALDSGKLSKLEEITADHNKINFIEPNCFGHEDICANLTIMNLSHNELEFLPNDFLTGAVMLKYLDLSHNHLQMIPDTILGCGKLQLLYLGQNKLTKLPDHIERLVDLRKLFISHNMLTTLPDKIGMCRKLVKLRVVHNKIRMMPASILDLWKEKGGRLEELLVDNNPMVQPSITAFTMGGMNQAFHLFEEWLKTEDLRKQLLEGEGTHLALQSEHDGASAKRGKRRKSATATRQAGTALAIPDGDLDARGVEGGTFGGTPDGPVVRKDSKDSKTLHDDIPPMEDLTHSFHYMHAAHDPAAVAEIRSAEVSLLFMKKSVWIEAQRRLAKEKAKEARTLGKEVPKHLRKFLDESFNVENFNGRINVSDMDMFLIMLVFVSKPMFPSAKALFDKFNNGTDDFMSKAMFNNLVRRLPVQVPPEIVENIWGLLNWRDSQSDRLSLVDFVAGWHTHDIEEDDVWVTRVCKSLNLDFYEMDVPELQDRVKAKGSEEASPVLMFPDGDESESSSEAADVEPPDLPLDEGERLLAHRAPQAIRGTANAQMADSDLEALVTPRNNEQESMKNRIIVSMDDEEYGAKDAANDKEEEESLMSDNSIGSDKLSKESDTEESDFEAQEKCKSLEELSDTEVSKRPDSEAARTKFEVNNDEDLMKLMNMPPEEILWEPVAHQHTRQVEKTKDEKKTKAHKLENKNNIRESRFHTDVFTVRIALREMHRNLPKTDFKKFVDFILRGLRNIKHSNVEDITYWHAEDPTFKSCVASNPYTVQLLEHMGFVCLNDVFWVWPSKHLNFSSKLGLWGNRCVAKRCPGRNPQRLDDMVALLRQCQRCLIRDGNKFNGHLRN